MQVYQIVLLVIAIVLILAFVGFAIFSYNIAKLIFNKFINPTHMQDRKTRMLENDKDILCADYRKWDRKDFQVKLKDGYIINGDITLQDKSKFVLFFHGLSSTREGMIRFARLFYNLGYSIVLYDHRGHGDNEKDITTMGVKESEDAEEVIDYLKKSYGKDIKIGLFGFSLGASVALLLLGKRQDFIFCVVDSGLSSIYDATKAMIYSHHSPSFMINYFMNNFAKKAYGIDFSKVKHYEILETNKVPLLILQGKKDHTIRYQCALKLYKHNLGATQLELFDDAGHGRSLASEPERYIDIINSFVEKYGK